MERTKIVFTDYYYPDISQELQILSKIPGVEIVDCTKIKEGGVKDEAEVIEFVRDADAVITQFAKISRTVIAEMRKCRIIARYAIGVDNIDLSAARGKEITVSNVPDYCIEEVSDTAVAHILGCVRKITPAHMYLHEKEWSYEKIKPLRRMSELTLGLLAFGNIARRVAEKMRPFDMRVIAYDPYFKDPAGKYSWVELVSIKELFSNSDIVSIHAPYSKETHHLVDAEKFSWMKRGSIIVNTSRGGLIDEAALENALKTGTVSMAGLDVLDYPDSDYLRSVLIRYSDQVIITPHMGWYSEESIKDLQRKAALNIYEKLMNGKPLYEIK